MYASSVNGLGEVGEENSGGFMSSLTNFLNTAVQTGGSVYSKVQQLTMANQLAKQQADQQAQMAQMQQWQFAQRLQSASSGLGGWTMPLILAGGALALFLFLKK